LSLCHPDEEEATEVEERRGFRLLEETVAAPLTVAASPRDLEDLLDLDVAAVSKSPLFSDWDLEDLTDLSDLGSSLLLRD
jgi:hypothetical protein